MEYKYISCVPLRVKGKVLNKGDVIELTEDELKSLPYWRFEKLRKREVKSEKIEKSEIKNEVGR